MIPNLPDIYLCIECGSKRYPIPGFQHGMVFPGRNITGVCELCGNHAEVHSYRLHKTIDLTIGFPDEEDDEFD